MRSVTRTSLLLGCCLLGGCAGASVISGRPAAAVAPESVAIYYIHRPECNFETVAFIQRSGGYFSLQSLLDNMRREAAELGASGLYLLQAEQSELREFGGTARAIRCLPV